MVNWKTCCKIRNAFLENGYVKKLNSFADGIWKLQLLGLPFWAQFSWLVPKLWIIVTGPDVSYEQFVAGDSMTTQAYGWLRGCVKKSEVCYTRDPRYFFYKSQHVMTFRHDGQWWDSWGTDVCLDLRYQLGFDIWIMHEPRHDPGQEGWCCVGSLW